MNIFPDPISLYILFFLIELSPDCFYFLTQAQPRQVILKDLFSLYFTFKAIDANDVKPTLCLNVFYSGSHFIIHYFMCVYHLE